MAPDEDEFADQMVPGVEAIENRGMPCGGPDSRFHPDPAKGAPLAGFTDDSWARPPGSVTKCHEPALALGSV